MTDLVIGRQAGIAAAMFAVALAGCTSPVPSHPDPINAVRAVPIPAQADDSCAARPFANLIGQDATALERVYILREIRLIRPLSPVSTDLRSGRINFDIDAANRIVRIWCG